MKTATQLAYLVKYCSATTVAAEVIEQDRYEAWKQGVIDTWGKFCKDVPMGELAHFMADKAPAEKAPK